LSAPGNTTHALRKTRQRLVGNQSIGRAAAFCRWAAELARDGDIVEIYPGTYPGDVALWPQNNLIVRGVDERPLVIADGKSVQRRDVWLFTGDDVVVENVEISGARSPWENGAGIRHIGSGLTLRHVFLHDNENGVLTSNRYPDTNEILLPGHKRDPDRVFGVCG
jgi:hypothetical protein